MMLTAAPAPPKEATPSQELVAIAAASREAAAAAASQAQASTQQSRTPPSAAPAAVGPHAAPGKSLPEQAEEDAGRQREAAPPSQVIEPALALLALQGVGQYSVASTPVLQGRPYVCRA
jgi:hypothetical protein